MMGGLNLGGTCLARHGQSSIFSSKTDQIMSRYRPIAPKPATIPGECHSNSIAVNSQPEKRINGAESISRHTRTRKRTSDSSNGQKRARGSSNPGGFGSERTGDIVADRSRTHIAYKIDGSLSMEALNGNGLMTVEKDSGFMERAAASGVHALNEESVGLGDVSVNRSRSGSVNSMDAVHIQAMRGPSDKQCSSGTGKSMVFPSVGNMQQEVRSQKEEENGKILVTLPLLPETPSSKVSTYQEADDEAQLRLFGRDLGKKEDGHYQIVDGDQSPEATTCVQSVDLSVWDLMYSGSPRPVMLLLDGGPQAVSWFNPAYKRIVKASGSNVEHSHVMNSTPLACFGCKPPYPGMVNSNVTLWDFTRPQMIATSEFGDKGCNMKRSLDDAITGPEQNSSTIKKGVIIPRPVRPVGSSVSIEYIKDTDLEASPVCKSIDEIEEEMESETLPALVSDSKNRVKRANAAYKEMVGQPECSWLESTFCHCSRSQEHSNSPPSAGNRINGKVVLTNQLPVLATSFSCGVKIQWTNNNGEKSSIRTLCDVVKFVASDPKDYVYAWKFHISAAFSLNSRS